MAEYCIQLLASDESIKHVKIMSQAELEAVQAEILESKEKDDKET